METFAKPRKIYRRRPRDSHLAVAGSSRLVKSTGSEVGVFQTLVLVSLDIQFRSRNNTEPPTNEGFKSFALASLSSHSALAKSLESHFIFVLARNLCLMELICLAIAEEAAVSTNIGRWRLSRSSWLNVVEYLRHFRASLDVYCPRDATRPRMGKFPSCCLILGGGRFRSDLSEEERVEWPQRVQDTTYFKRHSEEWKGISLRAAFGIDGAKEEMRRFLEECAKELNERKEVPVALVEDPSKSAPSAPAVAPSSNLPAGAPPASSKPAASAPVGRASTPRRSGRTAGAPAAYAKAGNGTPPKKKAKKKGDEGNAPVQPTPPQQKDQIKHSKGGAVTQDQGEDDSGGQVGPPVHEKSPEQLQCEKQLHYVKEKLRLFGRMKKTNAICVVAEDNVVVDVKRLVFYCGEI
jgi:hypothetical protein